MLNPTTHTTDAHILLQHFEAAPQAVAIFDKAMCYLFANKNWYRIYGLEGRDILHKSHYEIFPDIPQNWKDGHQRCLQNRETLQKEADPFFREDGQLQYMRWKLEPWYTPDDAVGGLIMYTEVVTEAVKVASSWNHIFNRSQDLIGSANFQGYFTQLNPNWEKVLGYSQEELKAQPFISFVHPDDVEATLAEAAKLSQGIDAIHFQNRYRAKSGEYRWLEWESSADTTQGLIYFVTRDVTESKKATQALQESEKRNRVIIESIPDLMFIFDREGVYLDMKDSPDLFAPREFLLGKRLVDLIDEKAGKQFTSALKRALDHGELVTFDYDAVIAGKIRNHEVRMVRLDDQRVLSLVRNVTQSKTAQIERERYYQQTEALYSLISQLTALPEVNEQAILETVMSVATEAGATTATLILLDDQPAGEHTEGTIVANWSQATDLSATLGTRVPLHEGEYQPEWQTTSTDEPYLIEEMAHATQLSSTARQFWLDKGIHALGTIPLYSSYTWVGMLTFTWEKPHTFTPLEHDLYRTYPSIIMPILKNTQLLEELNLKIRELNDSLIFKDQFLATMSHELRTPLNAILGYSSIATTYPDLAEKLRHMMERIKANSYRLLGLVNDVLDISRINAGRTEIIEESYNLKEQADGWYQDFKKRVEDKGLNFSYEWDDRLPTQVIGDSERLTQIVANLLGNAIKFTSEGGIFLSVALDEQPDRLHVSVRDTGIGISKMWHHLIFEEFRQVEMGSERRFGGSGLGLSIVQKLCTLMGGKVWVESELGVGSTFHVVLPLVTDHSSNQIMSLG
ncbi:MAG: PAS domain-containing sensor histidine kinase [Phototrophicaceae bacterium]